MFTDCGSMLDAFKEGLLRLKEPLLMGEAVWVGAMRADALFGQAPFNEDSWPFSLLDTKEKARVQKYRFWEDRLRFATGRLLSKTALSSLVDLSPLDISFDYTGHGKPFVRSPRQAKGFYLSISHSARLVAVAVGCGRQVGIDVEPYRRSVDIEAISRHFLSPKEILAIKEAKDKKPEAFIRTWTLKEAYAKASGLGLGIPFKSFGLILDSSSRIVWAPRPSDDDVWHFFSGIGYKAYRFGLCVQGPSPLDIAMEAPAEPQGSLVPSVRWDHVSQGAV